MDGRTDRQTVASMVRKGKRSQAAGIEGKAWVCTENEGASVLLHPSLLLISFLPRSLAFFFSSIPPGSISASFAGVARGHNLLPPLSPPTPRFSRT